MIALVIYESPRVGFMKQAHLLSGGTTSSTLSSQEGENRSVSRAIYREEHWEPSIWESMADD